MIEVKENTKQDLFLNHKPIMLFNFKNSFLDDSFIFFIL